MQRIGQLQSFVKVKEGAGASFAHPVGQEDQSRLIKMRILAEQPVNLFVEALDADPETGEVEELRFLAHIDAGMEELEFRYLGSFGLLVQGGNIWLDTYDNTAFNVLSVDPVSYARMWEREERDPRILEIEQQARHNTMRLQAQMEADRAEFAAMMAEVKKNVAAAPSVIPPASGSVETTSASVPPASDNNQSAPPAGGTGGQS